MILSFGCSAPWRFRLRQSQGAQGVPLSPADDSRLSVFAFGDRCQSGPTDLEDVRGSSRPPRSYRLLRVLIQTEPLHESATISSVTWVDLAYCIGTSSRADLTDSDVAFKPKPVGSADAEHQPGGPVTIVKRSER